MTGEEEDWDGLLPDELPEKMQRDIENFYDLAEREGGISAFTMFETFPAGVQAAILVDLPDPTFWQYLQDLGEEQVLLILQIPSIEFRERFLQVLAPKAKIAIEEELQHYTTNILSADNQKELEQYLLMIIGNVLILISENPSDYS